MNKFKSLVSIRHNSVVISIPHSLAHQKYGVWYDSNKVLLYVDPDGCKPSLNNRDNKIRIHFAKKKWFGENCNLRLIKDYAEFAEVKGGGGYECDLSGKFTFVDRVVTKPKPINLDLKPQIGIKEHLDAVNTFAEENGFTIQVQDNRLKLIKQEIIE